MGSVKTERKMTPYLLLAEDFKASPPNRSEVLSLKAYSLDNLTK
jgi:hypothetical protein